jgi:hypothetical protein
MSVLIIGVKEQDAIKAALARARKKVIPFDVLAATAIDQTTNTVTLEDRRKTGGDFFRPVSEQVLLPFRHRLAISYEEQPAGLCLHLSMSIDNRSGRLPGPAEMETVAIICGIDLKAPPACRTWVEEFTIGGQPGGLAINALFVVEPRAMQ